MNLEKSVTLLAFGLSLAGCASHPAPCPSTPPPAPAAPAAATPDAAPDTTPTVIHVGAETPDPGPGALRGLPVLPRPSPNAEVRQDVGVTSLRLTYSSPGAKNRTVWGELVPYGKVWRAGANAPTKLTVSDDFTFGGTKVKAGSYSLFVIPTAQKWTAILNHDPKSAGAFEHDPKQDVARVEVTSAEAPARERLAYLFENTTDAETELVLDWAGRRIAVPIAVDTKKNVEAGVAATLDNAWRPFFNAGRYALDQGDAARARELLEQSVAVKPTWWNHWWLAQAHAKDKQNAKAREHAETATRLGAKDTTFQRFFADQVKKALASWPES